MSSHYNLDISNFRFAILTSRPTALLGRGAFAAFERFAAGKTSAEGRLCRPEHFDPEGRSGPSARGVHKKGHDLRRVLFCGLRGLKARSALRDFNARGGRAAPAPRFSPAVKTLVRRTCAAAQKGRLAVLLQRFRPSKISILTALSMTSVLIAFEKL